MCVGGTSGSVHKEHIEKNLVELEVPTAMGLLFGNLSCE